MISAMASAASAHDRATIRRGAAARYRRRPGPAPRRRSPVGTKRARRWPRSPASSTNWMRLRAGRRPALPGRRREMQSAAPRTLETRPRHLGLGDSRSSSSLPELWRKSATSRLRAREHRADGSIGPVAGSAHVRHAVGLSMALAFACLTACTGKTVHLGDGRADASSNGDGTACPSGQVKAGEVLWIGDSWILVPWQPTHAGQGPGPRCRRDRPE